jgi:type II secretory pathway pseudopilin PulG
MDRFLKNAPSAGFTLIELIFSVCLLSIVMVGIGSILTSLILSQVYTAGAASIQLSLAEIGKLVEQELRQASLVTHPALINEPSAVLEGCDNAAGSTPEPIDTDAPMRWFAFCASEGIVYYHTGAGCPASYTCGASPTAAFKWGPAPQSYLAFTRPSAGSTLITANLQGSSGKFSAEVTSAGSFAAPAGGAQ